MYWFSQLVLGLRDIHKAKVMHKDIKSLNVFIKEGNRPMIGDFGVSAFDDPNNVKGQMVGSAHYMAPEVCKAKPFEFKSDIWSLGIILYELCTFKKPFDVDDRTQGESV